MSSLKRLAHPWAWVKAATLLLRNFILDGAVSLLPRVREADGVKASLLVVRVDAIGDFVLWLDAAAGLRALYPADRFRLVLAGNAQWIDLAALQPFFDEVIPVDTGRLPLDLRYRLSLWRRLRGTPWRIAVNPTFSRHIPYDDAIIRVCGAKERIGSQGDLSNQRSWEKRLSNRWYTSLISSGDQPLMELERNAEFIRGLGSAGFRAGLPSLRLPEAEDTSPESPYLVVAPGAGRPARQWPVEKFAAVLRRSGEVYGVRAVICGAPGEEALGESLRKAAAGARVEDRTGRTTLVQYAALIKGAVLVLANESSAVHVASAVGTPSVCIVGGGHYGRFVPYRLESPPRGPLPAVVEHRSDCYGCNWHCRYQCESATAPAPCLEQISVDAVWSKVDWVLAQSFPRT